MFCRVSYFYWWDFSIGSIKLGMGCDRL
uniref:Uncharacterized protein n=1 Tax=Rhizophora mucronata TaxID=61149 RepID=A0A2P2NBH0_RHIMU